MRRTTVMQQWHARPLTSVGHAVSADLLRWNRVPDVLSSGVRPPRPLCSPRARAPNALRPNPPLAVQWNTGTARHRRVLRLNPPAPFGRGYLVRSLNRATNAAGNPWPMQASGDEQCYDGSSSIVQLDGKVQPFLMIDGGCK